MTFGDQESTRSQTTGARTRPQVHPQCKPGPEDGWVALHGRLLGPRAGSRGPGLEPALFTSPLGLTHFVEEAVGWTGMPGPAAGAQGPSRDTGSLGATRKRAEIYLHAHAFTEMPSFRQLRVRESKYWKVDGPAWHLCLGSAGQTPQGAGHGGPLWGTRGRGVGG